jgi:phosphotransferase family enzyme
MGLEDNVVSLCQHTFNQAPLSLEALSVGRAAFRMFWVVLPGRKLLVRVGLPTERILGSLAFRPVFRSLGIPTAELLLAASETEFLDEPVQIFSELEGTDLLYAVDHLDDRQISEVAADVNAIQLALSTLESPGGFGPITGLERGGYPSWSEYILDEARLANLECLVRDLLPSAALVKLYRLLRAERPAFDEVPSTVFDAEIVARDLMVCRGRVRGLVDPSCLTLGDPLQFYGRSQAAWLGHPRGMVYVAALLDQAKLDTPARRRIDLYCALARLEWLAERGQEHLARWDPAGPVADAPLRLEQQVAADLIAAL